ncbi:HAD family hydrolase [Nocardioides bigeumensis]|uniref:HAD family hydrolase n=1 Tax=Nocardioides bigeumensis TaxID=433657 RepID=A0ABN2YUF4_9ACTN
MTGQAQTGLPRLVATDLDGTLVRSDGSVSAYTREVLTALEDAGTPLVFVTGRPLRWTEEVFEHVGEHGLAIVSNGALVWDVHGHRAWSERAFDREAVLAVARAIRERVPGSTFAVERTGGMALETDYVERYPVPDGSPRGALEEIVGVATIKLLARHEELAPQEFWDLAADAVGGLAVVTWSSDSSLLEISAPGVTKASTLAIVAHELGVAGSDVVAFGDMPNDLPMLEWAGTSYAVANAHPTVLAAADHVAPHHDEDGVAVTLAAIFGLAPPSA